MSSSEAESKDSEAEVSTSVVVVKVENYLPSSSNDANAGTSASSSTSRSSSKVDKYEMLRKVGEGFWGVVYKARERSSQDLVAIKKMKANKDDEKTGVNVTAIREIKFLQALKHKNIVDLVDIFSSENAVQLVLEFCPTDLSKIIKDRSINLKPEDVKSYIFMTLEGLAHCHKHFVLHRDMKPENLLISPSGEIKIADFGLARSYGGASPKTAQVFTIWYRAPELLFGGNFYTHAVDIWATGCIFAELMLRSVYFEGKSDSAIDQLSTIFLITGTPSEESWPGVSLLPNYIQFDACQPLDIAHLIRNHGPEAYDLLKAMTTLNPLNRPESTQALSHGYFAAAPVMTNPSHLPKSASTA